MFPLTASTLSSGFRMQLNILKYANNTTEGKVFHKLNRNLRTFPDVVVAQRLMQIACSAHTSLIYL